VVALGLIGRNGARRHRATVAVLIGASVVLLGCVSYIGEAVHKLS
jgi:hypothetical protein